MCPVLEQATFLPDQPLEVRDVIQAEAAPENEQVRPGNGARRIELEAAEIPEHGQQRLAAWRPPRLRKPLANDREPSRRGERESELYWTNSTCTGPGKAPISSPRRSSSVTAWRPSSP